MVAAVHQPQLLPHWVVAPLVVARMALGGQVGAHPLDIIGEEDKDGIRDQPTYRLYGLAIVFGRTHIIIAFVLLTEEVAPAHADAYRVALAYHRVECGIVLERRQHGCKFAQQHGPYGIEETAVLEIAPDEEPPVGLLYRIGRIGGAGEVQPAPSQPFLHRTYPGIVLAYQRHLAACHIDQVKHTLPERAVLEDQVAVLHLVRHHVEMLQLVAPPAVGLAAASLEVGDEGHAGLLPLLHDCPCEGVSEELVAQPPLEIDPYHAFLSLHRLIVINTLHLVVLAICHRHRFLYALLFSLCLLSIPDKPVQQKKVSLPDTCDIQPQPSPLPLRD